MDVTGLERAVTSFAERRLPVDFTERRIIAGARVVNVGLLARAINARVVQPVRETWDRKRIRDASLRIARGRYHPCPEGVLVPPTMRRKPALVARCADDGDYLLDGLTRVEAAHRAGVTKFEVLVVTGKQIIGLQGTDCPARVLDATLARPVVPSRVRVDQSVFRLVEAGVSRAGTRGRRRYDAVTRRLADAYYVGVYDLILLHGMRSGDSCMQSRAPCDEVALTHIKTELGYDLLDCTLSHFRAELNDSLQRIEIAGRREYGTRLSDEMESRARHMSRTSRASAMNSLWDDAVVSHRRLMTLFDIAKRWHLDQSDLARIEVGDARADLRNLRFVRDGSARFEGGACLTLDDLIAVAVDHGVNGGMLLPEFAYAIYLLQWWVQIHNTRSARPTKPDLAMAEIYLSRRSLAIRGEADRWSPFWLDIFEALSAVPTPMVMCGGIADWDVAMLRHVQGADLERDLVWRGDHGDPQSR